MIDAGLAQGGAIELIPMLEQLQSGDGDLPNQRDIHEWRHRRQQELEQPGLGHGDHAERSVAWAERHLTMLPEALQRAEGPTKPLLGKTSDRIRRLGPGNRGAVIQHGVAGFLKCDGQILVLGERIDGKAAHPLERLAPPGANGAGNDGDAAKHRQRAALQILARDIFECLPTRDDVDAVTDLGVAGDRTDLEIREPTHQSGNQGRSGNACRHRAPPQRLRAPRATRNSAPRPCHRS